MLLVIYDIVSLKEELSIRNHKPRSTFMSNMFAYLIPVLYFGVTAILSFFSLSLLIAFLIGLGVLFIILVPYLIYIKRNLNSLFMDLDVIN